MDLNKRCKHCGKHLTTENAAKKNSVYFRNECKSCRSFHVTEKYKGSEHKKEYMKIYHAKTKIVEEHECITCKKLCIKKYDLAFCSDACRLMNYVTKTETCWLWNGHKDLKGYGKTNIGSKIMAAHRAFYETFNGEIIGRLFVCHSCDNPSCVNPDHLWLGTHKQNMQDMHDKGRIFTKLTAYQVHKIRDAWSVNKLKGFGTELCKKYNITPGHLSNIVNRRIWKHI